MIRQQVDIQNEMRIKILGFMQAIINCICDENKEVAIKKNKCSIYTYSERNTLL